MITPAWLALVVAWLAMYVLLAAACIVLYRDAQRRGVNAELWLLSAVVPGSAGLLLILMPLLSGVQAAWICAPFGVLLTILGPIVYMISWGRRQSAST